ncbi:MAG: hypothetical protein Q7U55_11730 [Deltaproteobacteria bacterium]|nr:hypothetical protein [Deltaproteobacteria bacterium]
MLKTTSVSLIIACSLICSIPYPATMASESTGNLKGDCKLGPAEVYIVQGPRIGKHPDNLFPKDWENSFYPWLLPSARQQYFIGKTPIDKVLPMGDHLVAVCLRITSSDPIFKVLEVGHGAFWADERKDVGYVAESLGLRISKNGHRFSPKVMADSHDPFKPDDYAGTYIHHLGNEILYFRIYHVNIRAGQVTLIPCKLEKKAELPKSTSPGATGVLRGFTAEVPLYQ